MSKIFCAIHHNSECLSCGIVEKEMVKVGAMVFCREHYTDIFGEKEIDSQSEIFQLWLSKYWDKTTDSRKIFKGKK